MREKPVEQGNFVMSGASPIAMSDKDESARTPSRRERRPDRVGLWVLLALGVLLMLAAAVGGAEEAGVTARRTDRFNATLAPGWTLRIENVSGDISAAPGQGFSAVVTVSVSAPTRQKAEELLRATTVLQKTADRELLLRSVWPYGERGAFSPRMFLDPNPGVRRHGEARCGDCRITAQYRVTVPAGVRVILQRVKGDVRADGLDAEVEAHSVNGAVSVQSAGRSVAAESVNGKIDVALQSLPPSVALQAKTVNGAVLVTLPKDAKFDLSVSTMNGTISSTFPLPSRREAQETEEPPRKTDRSGPDRGQAPRRVVVRHAGEDDVVDVEALRKEIDESLKQVDVEVRDSLRELRHLNLSSLRGQYEGSVGQGGGKVRVSTLNGSIAVLAAGTREAEAKPLVPDRRSFAVTIPEIHVHPRPLVQAAPRVFAPRVFVLPGRPQDSVVRGDVSGDFLATSGGGSYAIGRVTGSVKILTRCGEIHVASAGAGADLKSYGGDVQIGPVTGDLKARTLAGDILAGAVSGSVSLETTGGDIRADAVGGSAGARTGGGDIVLPSVKGGVEAVTSGGDVSVGIASREARGGVLIRNSGGDVTLTLPADFRGDVDLQVHEPGDEDALIRSDFPEVTLTRQHGRQRAAGVLNGGGPSVVVETHSGSIRLRKGPAAGS
jgi:DUF4097 and DUF4098 domain-containing protein YvlB